ncbi:SPOR domain-containing protein [Pseudodesulfovibrio pelocollis]|uniref:SPOR domain-containing protein n=1 Tax=Pseudodesulfovibrio pelocollis TaxID=3051432 RepID=UPI00255AD5BA|nr:SPOR domain-containing protein [Pseudodesulfovibrio sp. SB368]
MMNVRKSGMMVAACLMAALIVGGCARQHIVSSPPAQRPSERTIPLPAESSSEAATDADAMATDDERRTSDGVYVVDAPTEEPTRRVAERELGEEPLPAEAASAPAATVAHADTTVADHTSLTHETHPGATATAMPEVVEGGSYFVQVGAFSDLENANRALARLIADGYKGSRLDTAGDGLFRVQAGSFGDHGSAEAALDRLRAQYPKGFVLKTD